MTTQNYSTTCKVKYKEGAGIEGKGEREVVGREEGGEGGGR